MLSSFSRFLDNDNDDDDDDDALVVCNFKNVLFKPCPIRPRIHEILELLKHNDHSFTRTSPSTERG